MAQHTANATAFVSGAFARVVLSAVVAGAVLLPVSAAVSGAPSARSGVRSAAVADGTGTATPQPSTTAAPGEWNSSGS